MQPNANAAAVVRGRDGAVLGYFQRGIIVADQHLVAGQGSHSLMAKNTAGAAGDGLAVKRCGGGFVGGGFDGVQAADALNDFSAGLMVHM